MARILVASMPFAGHTGPLSAVAAELVRRGHEVVAYTGAKYRTRFTAVGASWLPWIKATDFDDADLAATFPEIGDGKGLRGGRANGEYVLFGTAAGQISDIMAAAPYDLLVTDQVAFGGAVAGQALGIPWVTVAVTPLSLTSRHLPPFGLPWTPATGSAGRARDAVLRGLTSVAYRRIVDPRLNELRAGVGLGPVPPGRLFDGIYSTDLVLAQGVPGLEYPRPDLPAHVHFVGRLAPTAAPSAVSAEPKAVSSDVPGAAPAVESTGQPPEPGAASAAGLSGQPSGPGAASAAGLSGQPSAPGATQAAGSNGPSDGFASAARSSDAPVDVAGAAAVVGSGAAVAAGSHAAQAVPDAAAAAGPSGASGIATGVAAAASAAAPPDVFGAEALAVSSDAASASAGAKPAGGPDGMIGAGRTASAVGPDARPAPSVARSGPLVPGSGGTGGSATAAVELPAWWSDLTEAGTVVHVTQGTLDTDPDDLIRPTMTGLADRDVLVVCTTGGADPAALGPLPSNVRAAAFIPHDLLLPHVDVMVSNGGWGGVLAALQAGIPLVVAGDSLDKPEVARRVAWSGAGVNLRTGSPRPAAVAEAVDRVRSEPNFRTRARELGAALAGAGGVARAGDLIEGLLTR
jgi:UDP:flavonoid glycosyltransferase YjiC (YdhE family)